MWVDPESGQTGRLFILKIKKKRKFGDGSAQEGVKNFREGRAPYPTRSAG